MNPSSEMAEALRDPPDCGVPASLPEADRDGLSRRVGENVSGVNWPKREERPAATDQNAGSTVPSPITGSCTE